MPEKLLGRVAGRFGRVEPWWWLRGFVRRCWRAAPNRGLFVSMLPTPVRRSAGHGVALKSAVPHGRLAQGGVRPQRRFKG
jgi:hypothetical protein